MKKREFNKYIKQISDRKTKLIDVNKIKDLSFDVRKSMVEFIVRNRQVILKDLIPEGFDWNWLHAMGYLYEAKGNYFTFVHNSENRIK